MAEQQQEAVYKALKTVTKQLLEIANNLQEETDRLLVEGGYTKRLGKVSHGIAHQITKIQLAQGLLEENG